MRTLGAICLFGSWWIAVGSIRADEQLAASIDSMLAHTSISRSAREALREQYEPLLRKAPHDARIPYAFTLAQIRQYQYAEADELLDEVLQSEPDLLGPWQTRVWLSLLMRQNERVLHHIEQLGQRVASAAAEEPLSDQRQPHVEAAARFLGRAIAFLEGPAQGAVLDRMIADTRGALLAMFDQETTEQFELGYAHVAEQFERLRETQQQTVQIAQQEAEAERKLRLQKIREDREQAVQQQRDLQQQAARLREEAGSQLNELQQADQPLARELAQLDGQIAVVNRELITLAADINHLEALLEVEDDRLVRDRLLRDIRRFSALGRQYQADLITLRNRAAVVQRERTQLNNQQTQIQREMEQQLQDLEKQHEAHRRLLQRAEREEQRAHRSSSIISRIRTLDSKLAALTTYEPFPFEQLKGELLATFP